MALPKNIDRRYEVLGLLGSGLSGEIYRVKGPDGIAALKFLRTEVPGLNPEELITTFKFEFSLLKGLNHPNVVKIFDFGYDETQKRFYFTQELVEGAPIKNAVDPGDLETVQKLFIQALQGLAYLHSHDVLHGDLKPDNLLVSQNHGGLPQLKIIDFGISHPSFVRLAGTPSYMAPEKILKEPIDERSDLYSLAVVFYTLITGKNPFLRKNVPETLRAHLTYVAPAATSQVPELDPLWSELLSWMLKKNPRYRIGSAEASLKFLETKGETDLEITSPRLLPQNWIGRQDILENAKGFLNQIKKDPESNRILMVQGDTGLGKNNLLTELKFEAELKEIEVLSLEEEPARKPAIYFLKEENLRAATEKKNLKSFTKKASLVFAVNPEEKEDILKKLGREPDATVNLRPLNQEETETYLKDVTRNKTIPPPFLNALFRLSGGYPKQLQEALTHLLKDPQIVDASGKWHLAVFHEVEPTLEQLGFSEAALAHALAGPLVEDPVERWELVLKRASALANQGKTEEALKTLGQLEENLAKVFKGSKRLARKARLLEKKGYIYTKQGRFGEARDAFAAGISLLEESEERDPVLKIRIKNFLAYLDLQAGKNKEAIAQFQENAEEAEGLEEDEQKQITNNELGSAYLAQGQLKEAIQRLIEDLEFYAALPDPFLEMKASYNLAEAYCRNGQYPEAFHAYERVAEIARRERQWDFLVRAYNGLGNTATLRNKKEEALDYYQRSLALAEYLRDYLSATTVAQNRGVILSELGRLEEALYDLEISKRLLGKLPPSSHSRYLMARATLELGEVYLKKKDFLKARNYFTEAQNRSEEDPNLKSFRFYPLSSLAKLAMEEGEIETFRELYPKLVHLASTEEEKNILAELMAKTPADPRIGMEQEHLVSGKQTPLPESSISGWTLAGPAFPQEAWRSILKINRALITEYDPDKLFSKILEYATDISGAESALLLEVSEDNALSVRTAYNTPLDEAEREISKQVAKRVLETGQSIATHDALGDQDFNQFQSVVALKLRSIACIPIRLHQKVIGLLYLTHRNKTQLFNSEVIHLLEAFGDQAGLALQNARQVFQLQKLNQQLQHQLNDAEEYIDELKTNLRTKVKNPYPKILGKSRSIVDILKTLDRISDTNLTVLILGETGSGKELIARSIHDHSRRHKGPFFAVNCGAIPENLIESELFGYVKGAFTGANRDKKGLMEEAGGGTLFLDEVAELPPNMQVRLLRTLQEKEIMRLGSTQPIPVDIRVLAATHRNIEKWVREEKFREDLYYRLAQMILHLPPLRDRLEDLALLSEHFLQASGKELGLNKPPRLAKELLQLMMNYPWPGNVRELENMIRTASAFAERGVIHLGNLPVFLRDKLENPAKAKAAEEGSPVPQPLTPSPAHPESTIPMIEHWKWPRYEEALIAKSYIRHEQNCEKVAEELGVGIATVYVKIRKYGLKNKLSQWAEADLKFPDGLTVNELKQYLIERAYEQLNRSPYAVAKHLGLNVGTVYRYLKE